MLRAFSSAVAGMRSQMTFMDTVANNIANVNTTAFKAARVRFSDMLYQTLNSGAAPLDPLGGVNPSQIGLGVRVASIDTQMGQGALRATGNPLDLAVEGDGFFAVTDGTTTYYTRDGSFNIDATGNLVNGSNGMKVLDDSGSSPFPTIEPGKYASISVGPTGLVTGTLADGSGTEEIGTIGVVTFANPGGLLKSGDNLWRESSSSGTASPGAGADPDRASGKIRAGVLEGSNVDLAQEFSNMIAAQRSFQANSRVITTSDQILEDLVNIKR
jgi:flagellar hook protein FlgE